MHHEGIWHKFWVRLSDLLISKRFRDRLMAWINRAGNDRLTELFECLI